MSKVFRPGPIDSHETVDETEFLKTNSFDDLVRHRVRLSKDPLYKRKRLGEGRKKTKRVDSTINQMPPAPPVPKRKGVPYAQMLLTKGTIDSALFRAAIDYEHAYMAITGQLGFSASKLEPKRDRSWPKVDESARRQLSQYVYSEWRERVSDPSRYVMEQIIIHSVGIKSLEKSMGVRSGAVRTAFIDGLKVFAKCRTLILRRVQHFQRSSQDNVPKK